MSPSAARGVRAGAGARTGPERPGAGSRPRAWSGPAARKLLVVVVTIALLVLLAAAAWLLAREMAGPRHPARAAPTAAAGVFPGR